VTSQGPLTEKSILALKPSERRYVVPDGLVPGLLLRVSPSTVKTWALFYRTAGRQRFFTLGRYPDLTLGKAREAARRALAKARLGDDPHGEKLQAREHARKNSETTVEALTLRCLKALALRPKTLKEWGRLAEAEIIPAFGKRQAMDLTRADIRAWSERVGQRSGYTANRAFEVLRRVFSWSVEQDVLGASPFVGLRLPAKEHKSERVLSADEVRALWRALQDVQDHHPDYADAARLLLLTGVRRDMVLGMKRSELEDLDGREPRWAIPGGFEGRSKSGRAHVVPLSAEALVIVRRRLAATDGELLFPVTRAARAGEKPKQQHLTWSSRAVQAIRTATERHLGGRMARWRVHDLRHAVATHLREDLKVSSDVVSLILGHTPAGPRVTRIYDRSELLAERRAALIAWASWVALVVRDDGSAAAVLPLRRKTLKTSR
jgi:integrase